MGKRGARWPSASFAWLAHFARIRYRLLLVNVIIAAVPLVGISFAQMHETQLLAALEADMIHQAQLVRAMVAAAPDRPLADFAPVIASAAAATRTRIRLLDADGVVRADSHRDGPPEGAERAVPRLLRARGDDESRDPGEETASSITARDARRGEAARPGDSTDRSIDRPLTRREVQAALAGRYGAATRRWDHRSRVYLFSAIPVVRAPDRAVAAVVYVTRSTTDVKLQLFRLRSWLFRVLASTVALTALLTLLLATTIARPLGRLTRRAQRIASGQPIAPDGLAERRDEIGQLARAVGAMTDELCRRAHDARTLAADISHEFKTPLTGIRGAAELLRDGASDDPEARDRFLAMILDDAARLDRLVSRLLELARVEDDRGVERPVDLAALARDAAARPWPVPVAIGVDGDPTIHGRATPLASAIDNLIANATQFAEPGTTVRVHVARRATRVRLTVANHGPALSPTARARVWDRFYSTRVAAGGSGLGLAIVRSVALGHGGHVGVACDDGVTSFWIELPSTTPA
ncbi:MAG TPA: histidine kinase dimerization/phospho-acceptor domain-containing protein [Kofleriaceae bacterium]|nr:histidine kinase dimerization/phospho-acceptor domain-containing protein [Kofleriaceae bacterium]